MSSSHLVLEKADELSEVEMKKSADIGLLDILCLHYDNHCGSSKKLVDEYALFVSGSCKSIAASLGEETRQLRLLSGLHDQPALSATSF